MSTTSTPVSAGTFDKFLERTRTISDLHSTSAVLGWDQETYMPDAAAEGRAEQMATIDTIVHRMITSPESGELVDLLKGEDGLDDWQKATVREFNRTRDMSVKLPDEFVGEMSRTTSRSQHAWKKARAAGDFSLFRDDLARIVDMARRHAEYLGYSENPYDALIDLYEPGITAAQLRPVFARLKDGTSRLLKKIADSGVTVDDGVLYSGFDADAQLAFSREIVEAIGFDFNAGRVDLSAHPFCMSFGISDVRLTTRIFPDDLRSCLFGLIHEAGHGMYEQGINPLYARTPLAGGTSMGIHESQSLFWENVIGRSPEFWQWAFPKLQAKFPERLGSLSAMDFFRIVNVMKPSFIRVEADELTYNLHIILRFEMEDDLINGRLTVDEVPEVWNAKMKESLGIVPENAADGCLQDVHWSMGAMGYFPSYSLGKLYAAMFRNALEQAVPDYRAQVAEGRFDAILGWLRENIHQWGKSRTPAELVQKICGEPLHERAFLEYIEAKIDQVYSA